MDCSGLLNEVGCETLITSCHSMAPHHYFVEQNNSKPISIQLLFTLKSYSKV